MTILHKNIIQTVVPGQTSRVIGTPSVPPICTTAFVLEQRWVDKPGITWVKQLVNTASSQRFLDVTGKPVVISLTSNDPVIQAWTYVPYWYGIPAPAGMQVQELKLVQVPVTTCYPGIPARETDLKDNIGAILVTSMNIGWNSYAISISKLAKGQYVEFSVNDGCAGVFVGVGESSKYGKGLSVFSNGIMVDRGGIGIFEHGNRISTLHASTSSSMGIRLVRQPDGSVVYLTIDGTGTVEIVKSVASPGQSDMYIHAYLYSGGDRIMNTEIKTGKVVFGEVA